MKLILDDAVPKDQDKWSVASTRVVACLRDRRPELAARVLVSGLDHAGKAVLTVIVQPPDVNDFDRSQLDDVRKCVILYADPYGEISLEFGGMIEHDDGEGGLGDLLLHFDQILAGDLGALTFWKGSEWRGSGYFRVSDLPEVGNEFREMIEYPRYEFESAQFRTWCGQANVDWNSDEILRAAIGDRQCAQ